MEWLASKVGGDFNPHPEALLTDLSVGAQELIQIACQDLGATPCIIDHHCHIAGLGHGESGCKVHRSSYSVFYPIRKAKFYIFLKASGITDEQLEAEIVDRAYVERLADLATVFGLATGIPLKTFILALDHWYEPDGRVNEDKTGVYVPNEYVLGVAEEFPDLFTPAVSVHPYREDALEELDRCYARGARMVKWLPNAMGINPSDEKCDPFYDKMKELGMVLLSHTGKEHTIAICADQSLGNPLLLRRPLDRGVKVIAAHCASEGTALDIDEDKPRSKKQCFDLFLRLMDEPQYVGLLFGDISSVTAFKRLGKCLTTILNRKDLHSRFLFGSDYPVPAVNFVVQTKALVRHGYITAEERQYLNEIYQYNPLLFDFVVKRTIRSPDEETRFAPFIFLTHPGLPELYPASSTNKENDTDNQAKKKDKKKKKHKEKKEKEVKDDGKASGRLRGEKEN